MRDFVIAPGAQTPERGMMNDMLCHMTEGELAAVQNKKEFTVTCGPAQMASTRRVLRTKAPSSR
jgi:hypothetical protein